jgi:lipopolysaccharide transport system ATP-binding protein
MSETVIQVEGLGKRYRIGQPRQQNALSHVIGDVLRAPLRLLSGNSNVPSASSNGNKNICESSGGGSPFIWALKDINFEVKEGEVVGLIGRNGAGKSTLLKILARVTRPTEGHAELHGRIGSLLEVGTGFHPELTGRENVFMSGAVLGMRAAEIRRKFDEIVAFSEVERFLDTPLKHFSSGMQMRLAFAVAAHLEPEILFVDEVLAVGDVAFQKKCLGKMGDISKEGRTIVFISHHMNQIRRLCTRTIWLDASHIRQEGNTIETVNAYESAMSNNGQEGLANRSGDRAQGEFLNWQIANSAAGAPNTITTLDEVIVEFRLELKRPVRRGVHGITLYNSDRQIMWGWACYELDLEAGLHELTYKFPVLPLKPGTYTWMVSFWDEHELIDMGDMVPELQVLTPTLQHPRDEWSGVMNLPVEFRIDQRVTSQIK